MKGDFIRIQNSAQIGFSGGPEPLPAFHQSNPSESPLSSLKHYMCTFWTASQPPRTLTVVTTPAVREDASASVYLTDSCTRVRSRPRTKQALLNRQAAPKGMRDSHPYKHSLEISPLRKTSHSQLLPSHSALTNTPNSPEMPGVKRSPGPAHQRSRLMMVRTESGMDRSFHLTALF